MEHITIEVEDSTRILRSRVLEVPATNWDGDASEFALYAFSAYFDLLDGLPASRCLGHPGQLKGGFLVRQDARLIYRFSIEGLQTLGQVAQRLLAVVEKLLSEPNTMSYLARLRATELVNQIRQHLEYQRPAENTAIELVRAECPAYPTAGSAPK